MSNAEKCSTDLLCGIDQYGRAFMPVSGMDRKKDVGMFYFLWHGESGQTTYDVTKLLRENPEALWDTSGPEESPVGRFHYWGEPLFGYYNSTDPWVARKHAEMLSSADIDFLVFDTTNAVAYNKAWQVLLAALEEYRLNGCKVPKIAFYTNSYSIRTMKVIYDNLYGKNLYRELWYCPDGEHPMIIGHDDPMVDKVKTARDCGESDYMPILTDEMKQLFDIRQSQWPFYDPIDEAFPWMEWSYPQPIHNGIINVSLAQHPQLPFSDSIKDRTRNYGRGYNFETKENDASKSRLGLNIQSQWNTALANKEKIHTVFVTGFNEWIAIKMILEGRLFLVDCANEEFSRDIEPMKGGYEDAFYLQLIDNVRRFKGLGEPQVKNAPYTVNMQEPSSWSEIPCRYKAVAQTAIERNDTSVDGKYIYQTPTPRNNIQAVSVAHDEQKLYFAVECEKEIVGEGTNWMNILFGVGEPCREGWEGYQFVVNRRRGKLCRLNKAADITELSDAELQVSGNRMAVAVPLAALEIPKDCKGIYFKVSDGMLNLTDIMDSYTNGKSVPMGRLSYYYYF